ncbi:Crp/Fnr family transcriptional regulator [Aeromicrobium alkaliterrae]|uniref:HTH crp-type domain-containing protein n=1 Tax=Aeromicrobium alkaliterrae TaxID=302168 RepID=A0ABN2JPZ8_9ACTN
MSAPQQHISPSALEAWSKSFLADQDPAVRDALLVDSRQATYPAGGLISRENNYKVVLVNRGQLRAKITAWDGREATTRYVTAGQFSALPAMMTDGAPSSVEAVSHCEVTIFNPQTFRRLMRTRADLCYAVAVYLAESSYESVANLEDNLFKSVQQRVSRHLLEMATPTVNGLLVQTDQTDLAHAIGSVREVVSRALRKLSDAGAIRRNRRQIWIEDPALLRDFASTDPVTPASDQLRVLESDLHAGQRP